MHNGHNMESVIVSYPTSSSNSNYSFGYMRITEGSGWRTILHEYGHHVGNYLNIVTISVFTDYDSVPSLYTARSQYGKIQCLRLAWVEAWAIHFSNIVRHYYWQSLQHIEGIEDISSINMHTQLTFQNGEASVRTIAAVLWKVYRDILNKGREIDSIQNGNQAVKNTHKILWDAIINSQVGKSTKSISHFAVYFASKYPQYMSEFGEILEFHSMSATNLRSSAFTQGLPPTFNWDLNVAQISAFPLNKYELVFFNTTNSIEILRIEVNPQLDILLRTHKISVANWNILLNSGYKNINVYVVAYQIGSGIGNAITTGGYVSKAVSLELPVAACVNHAWSYSNMTHWQHSKMCIKCGHQLAENHSFGKPVYAGGSFAWSWHRLTCACGYFYEELCSIWGGGCCISFGGGGNLLYSIGLHECCDEEESCMDYEHAEYYYKEEDEDELWREK